MQEPRKRFFQLLRSVNEYLALQTNGWLQRITIDENWTMRQTLFYFLVSGVM